MKILLFSDNHFCERSSILTGVGERFTVRLENQIKSLNWVEDTAVREGCEAVICLGDFFDKPNLTDQELTALTYIRWNEDIPHYFIVGNHDSAEVDLRYSSTHALEGHNRFIVDKPARIEPYILPDMEICALPYILESERLPLSAYFGERRKFRLILSHNDLKGVQMGAIVSKSGFSLEDIDANCDLFINGHLHNGARINSKVVNIGNLTGKDFGEDGNRYPHNVFIFDTDIKTYSTVENPYAFNFYKFRIDSEKDLKRFDVLKDNCVLYITTGVEFKKAVEDRISRLNAVESKVVVEQEDTDSTPELNSEELKLDYVSKFVDCCHDKLGHSDLLEQELTEICSH